MATTIQVSDDIWIILNRMKNKGETFEEVIRRLIKIKEELDGA